MSCNKCFINIEIKYMLACIINIILKMNYSRKNYASKIHPSIFCEEFINLHTERKNLSCKQNNNNNECRNKRVGYG